MNNKSEKSDNTKNRKIELYVYKKLNHMDGYKSICVENEICNNEAHRYTDDVALCYAHELEEVISIFSRLYVRESIKDCVEKAWFNNFEICICTDY